MYETEEYNNKVSNSESTDRKTSNYLILNIAMIRLLQPSAEYYGIVCVAQGPQQRRRSICRVLGQRKLSHQHPEQVRVGRLQCIGRQQGQGLVQAQSYHCQRGPQVTAVRL